MKPSSEMKPQITAILGCRRKRKTSAKIAAAYFALALFGLEFLMGGCTTVDSTKSWSLGTSKVSEQLKHFVAEKEVQASAAAKTKGEEMLPEFKSIFAAAAKGNWRTMINV